MENICKIVKVNLFFLVVFLSLNVSAQSDFYVNTFEGIPYLEVNDSIKPITKGFPINKNGVLTLNDDDVVHFINEEGKEHVINNPGKYPYSKLLEVPAIESSSSFATTYISYVWKKFRNNGIDPRSRSGYVVRGDDVLLMQYPVDSAKVFGAEVSFKWFEIKDKEKNYYLVLKDSETDKMTIIGTPATSLELLVDENVLKAGHQYEWAITETKYPTKDKTTFYSFSLMKDTDLKAINVEIKTIISYLKQQGLNRSDIQKALCEAYKICY
jgi:hypothetical protein